MFCKLYFAEKLVSEPDFPSFLEVELLTKLELWTTVNTAYKRLIESKYVLKARQLVIINIIFI